MLDLARRAGAGFDLERFAQSLDSVGRIQPEEVRAYRITPAQLDGVKDRMKARAAGIRACARHERPRDGLHERMETEVERRRAARDDAAPHWEEPSGRAGR